MDQSVRNQLRSLLSNLSKEDLKEVNKIIKAIYTNLQREQVNCFSVGDNVDFKAPDGRLIIGSVVRLNEKTVSVRSANGLHWRVSPGFLSKVS